MKRDVVQYDRIYRLLKSRIESGRIPVGQRLPGRADLCREFHTSERTIRHVVKLLEEDGFLKTEPKRRSEIVSAFPKLEGRSMSSARKADAAQVEDLLHTGILLCYPIYLRGLHLCTGDDWHTPDLIFSGMDPGCPEEFWKRSTRLWRFFIARNENELLMRAVDSLGFQGKEPPPGRLEDREQYCRDIESLFQIVKNGGEPDRSLLEAIFAQYRLIARQAGNHQFLQLLSPSPILAAAGKPGQQLSLVQERYSTVCLDLLGLISIGRYQPGDRLPTHDQLQERYGVSRDTTVKAIHMLEEWGVVTAAPRRGIFVMMDLEGLQKIQITPESIASHVRRYLDSLDLLSLTVERVAAHGGALAKPEEVETLKRTLAAQWNHPSEHQLIPRTLLDFITEHIEYEALRSIYEVVARNFSIGRSIPKLVSQEKNPENQDIYRQCMGAASILSEGDVERFARVAAGMFQQTRTLILEACRRLGYWDAARKVYDGTALWK